MFELLVHMCFGARLPLPDDELLDEIEQLQHKILLSVASFPIFAFFPAITKRLFRKRWEELVSIRRRQDELFLPLIHHHQSSNSTPPCYADSLLKLRVPDGEEDRPLTDSEMVSLCSEFLNGGTDTTVTLVEWIMAELVNHPDVQAKLRQDLLLLQEHQEEAVGGKEKMLKAVILEGLRLHPPGHFVLPHGVQTESDIGGYTVPRGAEVNFMVADIGRDATAWTAPMEFRPERFLHGGEGCGVDITGSREIKMMPFGAGRRMCPGYALGIHHAEYFVARMVRDLHWLPSTPTPTVVDENHQAPAVNMEEALDFTTVMKHPLRARIVPVPTN
ncbi:hypothetical protein PR202_gb05969 [Eleusine coracana subsp. coracana]|uniref:Cytochrome P450 89A2 n=1 Tax=Eleusine coracana subsp. coracana TaxID=191504 RepID=A0AAV5E8C7_ELECO|nr:hypothetical protein PR202_gb05969 [Eleusine coracana subsp. coracana]